LEDAIVYSASKTKMQWLAEPKRPTHLKLGVIKRLEGAVSSTVPVTGGASGIVGQFTNGLPHIANFYKFNLGRAALKIKPGEAFNFKITWPGGTTGAALTLAATLNNNLGATPTDIAGWLINVYIVGLSWSPL
jgi:hypothetical protein